MRISLAFFIVLLGTVQAQEVAIFDRGLNTTYTNRGIFYNPMCIGRPDRWVSTREDFYLQPWPLPGEFDPDFSSLNLARYVTMYEVSLCYSSHAQLSSPSTRANVPRVRTIPANNSSNLPYLRIGMWDLNAPIYDFNLPFNTRTFGANLRHGTDVANAVYEFDTTVRRKMVQLASIIPVTTDCSTNSRVINPNTASFGGTDKVIQALDEIIANPDGVDAVNMSFQYRVSSCARDSGVKMPPACDPANYGGLSENRPGQFQVTRLNDLGIAVVAGLLNEDIGDDEKTWPACLDNVIKVGAENGNSNIQNGGIGIGANGINLYAKNTVSANGGAAGNSMAAPRIAAAYALLKTAVPSATVDQISLAIEGAVDATREYDGHPGTYVRKSDIPEIIDTLQQFVDGNIDNIGYGDEGEYGPLYDDDSIHYAFEIDFNNLVGSTAATTSNAISAASLTSPSNVRDVVISFDALFPTSLNNGFDIYVNNIKVGSTPLRTGANSFHLHLAGMSLTRESILFA